MTISAEEDIVPEEECSSLPGTSKQMGRKSFSRRQKALNSFLADHKHNPNFIEPLINLLNLNLC